jgi:lipopolysaccharide transport system ATP-binding protein
MAQAAIHVEGLGKRYALGGELALRDTLYDTLSAMLGRRRVRALSRTFWALRDVDFSIPEGEVTGIIGRNGAGKSTLLKILSRITAPTEGRATLRGRLASLLEVGTGFHPELTGRENIFLNGSILGMRRAEIQRQFDDIVEFAEVQAFVDTPVKRYSSGMYVRLAFSVAAHLDPDILLVDEVLAVGDASFQKRCLGKMRDIAGQGRTVLFVSHNMTAVEHLTSTALWIDGGSLKMHAATSEVVAAYSRSIVPAAEACYSHRPKAGRLREIAAFTELRLEREFGKFSTSEDIEFFASVRANQPLKGMRISMTVFDESGHPVGACFGRPFTDMSAGQESEFAVKLPRPRLAPGRYYCAVAVGTGDFTTGYRDFDIVMDTLPFEIIPERLADGVLPEWQQTWGRVMLPLLEQAMRTASNTAVAAGRSPDESLADESAGTAL